MKNLIYRIMLFSLPPFDLIGAQKLAKEKVGTLEKYAGEYMDDISRLECARDIFLERKGINPDNIPPVNVEEKSIKQSYDNLLNQITHELMISSGAIKLISWGLVYGVLSLIDEITK